MKKISIAIDGPAASGKSTTARLLAKKLNYVYIDTGAMYRAATLAVIQEKINPVNEELVTACIKSSRIRIGLHNGEQHTFLNEEDVSSQIRTPEINNIISIISTYAEVRKAMAAQQRLLAGQGGVVMDGRDIGTVVLPKAELKVFMGASLQERAKRRLKEQQEQGVEISLQEVEKEISRRDQIDSSRSQAPLKKADDARELDNSAMTIDEQVEMIYGWVQKILSN